MQPYHLLYFFIHTLQIRLFLILKMYSYCYNLSCKYYYIHLCNFVNIHYNKIVCNHKNTYHHMNLGIHHYNFHYNHKNTLTDNLKVHH